MEIRRTKNVATVIVFPIQKNDGTYITGAAGLDSEIDHWADGSAPNGFADCTNEAAEIGTTGIYSLALTQAECNYDYSVVQVKSSTTGALAQTILINRTNQQADVAAISGDSTAANNCELMFDGTGYAGGTTKLDVNVVSQANIDFGATQKASIATAILGAVFEGSLTIKSGLRVFLAALAGKSAGGGTGTRTFRDAADAKDRITATIDASNNRTAITLDGTD
jgi:hypothetical protein